MLIRLLVLWALIAAVSSESRLVDDASGCGWRYNYSTNSYEYGCEALKKSLRWNIPPEHDSQKTKRSKRRQGPTNKVNFVLINKGVDYRQRDRSKNIHQLLDIRSNCVIFLGHDNTCHGWTGKKDRAPPTTSPPIQFQGTPEDQVFTWPPYEIEEAETISGLEGYRSNSPVKRYRSQSVKLNKKEGYQDI